VQTARNIAALRRCKPGLRAAQRGETRRKRSLARIRKHLAGDAARWPGALQVLRRFKPGGRRSNRGVAQRLVGEEREHSVLQDRPADAAAFLIEPVGVAPYRGRSSGSVPALEGIQARTMPLEERAAVEFVGAVLRDDHDLRAA